MNWLKETLYIKSMMIVMRFHCHPDKHGRQQGKNVCLNDCHNHLKCENGNGKQDRNGCNANRTTYTGSAFTQNEDQTNQRGES